MPQENVELLRRGLDAFFRRDRQAWLALCDPDFESVPSDDWPEMDPIRGAEGAWEFYVETDESWETTPYEYVHVLDAGDGQDCRANAPGNAREGERRFSRLQLLGC